MFSIQKFFSHDEKFHDLLEENAREARASTKLLIGILRSRESAAALQEFTQLRRKEKRIAEQISEELVNTFVTGIEREDIEALSYAIYRIPKTMEKFAERYSLSPKMLTDVDFTRQIELVDRATETLCTMVKQLRNMGQLEEMKKSIEELQKIESDADDLIVTLLREVYSGKFEPLQAMLVRDLYDILEKVIDRCRDAGNVVSHIVLKNS